jgi:hypothetical protein
MPAGERDTEEETIRATTKATQGVKPWPTKPRGRTMEEGEAHAASYNCGLTTDTHTS